MSKKDFDPKCLGLAECFLEDEHAIFTDRNCDELALEIQRCVEDFIAGKIAEAMEDEARAQIPILVWSNP